MYRPACDRRFRVRSILGEGGTARVVRAFDAQLQRDVALKCQAEQTDLSEDTFRNLVRREYQLVGAFHAPQLVNVLDSPSPSYSHLVLQLCEGPTAAEVGRIEDVSAALNLITAIALSLETVHALGIIHGDLKSHNVFLPLSWDRLWSGQVFWAKVSDFSLGRRADQPDKDRLGRGTVGWMAPETLADGTTSVQSDLFALGLVAYTMMTGVHPFLVGERDPVAINSLVRESPHRPVQELRPETPPVLAQLIDRLLSKDPSQRPSSAIEACRSLSLAGATYDFRLALQPSHLFSAIRSYVDNCAAVLALKGGQVATLADYTGEQSDNLRLLLTANFRRGNLEYRNYRFHFVRDIYWPWRLRRFFLGHWKDMDTGAKRRAVTQAVLASAIRIVEPDRADASVTGLTIQLSHLLRPRSVRRVALRLTNTETARPETIPILLLMAGRYEEAATAALATAGRYHEEHRSPQALRLLRHTIRICAQAGRTVATRPLLCRSGDLYKQVGELDRAIEAFHTALALSDEASPDTVLASACKGLGETYRLKQNFDNCLKYLSKALAALDGREDELELSHVHNNLGNAYWMASDIPKARHHYLHALSIQKRLKARFEIASTTHNLASLFCIDGRVRRGVFLLEHALSMKQELGHQGEIARTLNNLSYAYSLLGRTGQAADAVAESLAINRRIGSQKELLFNLENAAYLMIKAARLEVAWKHLDEGLRLSAVLNDDGHRAIFLTDQARAQIVRGRLGEAARNLAEAHLLTEALADRNLPSLIETNRARLLDMTGDRAGAIASARLAWELLTDTCDASRRIECLQLLAQWTDDSEALSQFEATVKGSHSESDALILRFARLAFHREQDPATLSTAVTSDWLSSPLTAQDSLDLPWMALLSAEVLIAAEAIEPAEQMLGRAENISRTAGLVPYLIETLLWQGRLAVRRGDYQAGFTCLREALALSKGVSELIWDHGDRVLYQKSATVQTLAIEIKALAAKLGSRAAMSAHGVDSLP